MSERPGCPICGGAESNETGKQHADTCCDGSTISFYAELGAELLRLRLLRGFSLRKLARMIGMTAHSGLVDYERGRRIPPLDLMDALLRALQPPDDRLRTLYHAAIGQRVNRRWRSVTVLPAPWSATAEPAPLSQMSAALTIAESAKRVSPQEIGTVVDMLEAIIARLKELPSSG